MKLLQISAIAAFVALASSAQANELPKAFSFTVVPDGETPATISGILTTAEGDNMMQIDWGDGELTDAVAIEDYNTTWTPTVYSAVPKGETITVYADPTVVHYIDGSWGTGTLKWTSVDVSALAQLKSLEVPSNALTAIDVKANADLTKLNVSCNDIKGAQDLSANPELTSVNFSNTEALGTNNVDGSDFTCLTKLSTLNVSNQNLTDIKVAGIAALATLNITACHLPAIDLTGCTGLKTLNGNMNDFETIDISECVTAKSYFYLNNCKLSSITTAAAYTGNTRLQITGNCFTFATLPPVDLFSTYTYSPQANLAVEPKGLSLDLSEYLVTVGDEATEVSFTSNGEVVDESAYTVEDGIYTFAEPAEAVVALLTNKAFPALTLSTVAVDLGEAEPEKLPKAFSFTVVPDGETPAAISGILTTAEGDNMMQIDWGDGELTDAVAIEDYNTTWTPTVYSAVPKGETITVYADPAVVHYIDGSWGTGTLKWTSVDVSALAQLKSLEVPSNALTAIDVKANAELTKLNVSCNDIKGAQDLSANPELTSVNFSNTEALGTNNVDGSDFTCLTKLNTLNVSYQNLTDIKVAGIASLATLNITACHLPAIDLTGCTGVKTLNGNLNDFETIDISECVTAKSYFYLNNCKLSSIKTAAAYTGNTRLQITGNCFTFATLPAVDLFSNYTYSPQADITIEAQDGKVNLSEYMPVIGEDATIATWTDGDKVLEEGTDYTVEDTVFTFLVDVEEAKVALTNAAFPALTLNSNAVKVEAAGIVGIDAEIEADAVYYNVYGQRISSESINSGIYIKVQGNKAQKVYVK